jgi:hypothetical protein
MQACKHALSYVSMSYASMQRYLGLAEAFVSAVWQVRLFYQPSLLKRFLPILCASAGRKDPCFSIRGIRGTRKLSLYLPFLPRAARRVIWFLSPTPGDGQARVAATYKKPRSCIDRIDRIDPTCDMQSSEIFRVEP